MKIPQRLVSIPRPLRALLNAGSGPIARTDGTVIILVATLARASAVDPNAWKAGAAKTDVTPTESIRMDGFGFRTHPSEGIRQAIYSRALALQDGSGRIAVICTLDLATINREMAELIAGRCMSQYGLERDRLVINLSHTHSGPVAALKPEPDDNQTAEQAKQWGIIQRYTESLIDRTVATVGTVIPFYDRASTFRFSIGRTF